MDRITNTTRIPGCLSFCYIVGREEFSLRRPLSLAATEFESFVQETVQFIMLWKLLEPYKAGPQPYVSETTMEVLRRLERDVPKILDEFYQSVENLQREDQKFIKQQLHTAGRNGQLAVSQSSWVPSPEARLNILREFFNRDYIRFQRDRLQYAKNHLNIILSIISVTQTGHIIHHGEDMATNISTIMAQQDQLHEHLMEQERCCSYGIQAHRWIGRLPPQRPGRDPDERIEEMAQQMISPRPSGINHQLAEHAQPHHHAQNERLREAIRSAELWRDAHTNEENRRKEVETENDRLTNNLKSREDKIQTLQAQLDQNGHAGDSSSETIARYAAREVELTRQIDGLRAREAELTRQIDGLRAREAELTLQINGLRVREAELTRQIDDLQASGAEPSPQIDDLQARVNELTVHNQGWQIYVAAVNQGHQEAIQHAQARIQMLERSNEEFRVRSEEFQRTNERMQENVVQAQNESRERGVAVQDQRENLRQARQEMNLLRNMTRRLRRERNERQATIRQLDERAQNLEARIEDDAATASAQRRRVRRQIQELEEDVRYYRAQVEHLRACLRFARRDEGAKGDKVEEKPTRRRRRNTKTRAGEPDMDRTERKRWTHERRRRRPKWWPFCF